MKLIMSLLYKSQVTRGQAWQAIFSREMPDLAFHIWPEPCDLKAVKYLVTWQFTPKLIDSLPALEVIFSVGAGADQFDLSHVSAHIKVVRMIDTSISDGMGEYITFATLYLHRHMMDYHHQQAAGIWHEIPLIPGPKRTVGIMGLGQLGQVAINRLKPFGFKLRGWSRSAHQIDGVEGFAGEGELKAFLAGCDILICLLPLTAETTGILCRSLFESLPKGASVINAGRGGHLVEADLIDALYSGQLSGAVIDVLSVEPAPATHSFFNHPRILLTPHIAAMTDADSAGHVLLDNVRRHRSGQDMVGQIDRKRGY
ncbi:glyoxylate/hydroxypyruvate reductase A [Asticcacaulis endophyticus]|uniref:Glyoxylate/hydroxypyruvate reductase A n=2 Tax=Asticcacaulis endophyticus TaxID=1395890 RepID=A0A918Q3M4_9CAUL|nr:glyoxylate/hydroxypyruvate reductase A [Asticcacaulis endophyticus]